MNAGRTEEHQTLCAESRRQMNQAALAADVQQTVRQNVFCQLQVHAEIMAVCILNFDIPPPH